MRILSLFLTPVLAQSYYRSQFDDGYTRRDAYRNLLSEMKSQETQFMLRAARPSLDLANRCMDRENVLLDKCLRKRNCRYYALQLPIECE